MRGDLWAAIRSARELDRVSGPVSLLALARRAAALPKLVDVRLLASLEERRRALVAPVPSRGGHHDNS